MKEPKISTIELTEEDKQAFMAWQDKKKHDEEHHLKKRIALVNNRILREAKKTIEDKKKALEQAIVATDEPASQNLMYCMSSTLVEREYQSAIYLKHILKQVNPKFKQCLYSIGDMLQMLNFCISEQCELLEKYKKENMSEEEAYSKLADIKPITLFDIKDFTPAKKIAEQITEKLNEAAKKNKYKDLPKVHYWSDIFSPENEAALNIYIKAKNIIDRLQACNPVFQAALDESVEHLVRGSFFKDSFPNLRADYVFKYTNIPKLVQEYLLSECAYFLAAPEIEEILTGVKLDAVFYPLVPLAAVDYLLELKACKTAPKEMEQHQELFDKIQEFNDFIDYSINIPNWLINDYKKIKNKLYPEQSQIKRKNNGNLSCDAGSRYPFFNLQGQGPNKNDPIVIGSFPSTAYNTPPASISSAILPLNTLVEQIYIHRLIANITNIVNSIIDAKQLEEKPDLQPKIQLLRVHWEELKANFIKVGINIQNEPLAQNVITQLLSTGLTLDFIHKDKMDSQSLRLKVN